MGDDQNLIKSVDEGATYDEYLKALEDVKDGKQMIPFGTIVFPVPSSLEEYAISRDVKGKILFNLFQQNLYYGICPKQITLWSLMFTEDVKNLTSWEDLDPSDFTIILTESDYEYNRWSIIYEENKDIAFCIAILFDKNNKVHMKNAFELCSIEQQKLDQDGLSNADFVQVIIPVQRILGIIW